jgi:mannosyltransferase OCH1-like enzyme
MFSRVLYERETNWGSKADIARYEIIYSCGGIYCDIDSVSLRPFDDLFERPFVAGILHTWNNVSNAVFGFPRHSSFLAFVLRSLTLATHHAEIPSRTGPTFFTTCVVSANDSRIRIIDQGLLIQRSTTGYSYHTCDANWL